VEGCSLVFTRLWKSEEKEKKKKEKRKKKKEKRKKKKEKTEIEEAVRSFKSIKRRVLSWGLWRQIFLWDLSTEAKVSLGGTK